MFQKTGTRWAAAILMAVLLGACATFTSMHNARKDRGIKAPHKQHLKDGMACTDCHSFNDKGEAQVPNHDICSACHDFDVNKPDDKCNFCHTRADQKVDPLPKLLGKEVKYSHTPHTSKGLECSTCHTDPDSRILPLGSGMKFCMEFCLNCHKTKKPGMTECSFCHTKLNKDVRPTSYQGLRIPHDNPQMWESLHGQQSVRNPEFCGICHDKEAHCEACHRKNAPKNHDIAWRGRIHGMRASWDRQKCSVCHEEDSCIKCHKHSTPTSHRGGWGEPLNTHCVSCHYPPSDNGCTVCHENIEHPKALASPHNIGIYGACGLCHPGGVPYRAPHIMNTSIKCLACH